MEEQAGSYATSPGAEEILHTTHGRIPHGIGIAGSYASLYDALAQGHSGQRETVDQAASLKK